MIVPLSVFFVIFIIHIIECYKINYTKINRKAEIGKYEAD